MISIANENAYGERLKRSHRLALFFAAAYLAQGVSCAQFGVIAQPIQYFMMKGLGLTAAQISFYLAIMMIPWVVKPFYGLICDFIPLFGYRRKSYLIIANTLAASAFAVMAFATSLQTILASLFCTAIAMAMATALMVGLAVERSHDDGKACKYFCIQEICYYAANMAAALVGGALCQTFLPVEALHVAAVIAVVPLIAISTLTALMLSENKTELNLEKLRETGNALLQAFRSPALWTAAMFSWCWNFTPSNGVPLYFFESNTLHFSQSAIGQLAACNAAGMLLAALFYERLARDMPLRSQLLLSVVLVSISTFAYLALSSFSIAIVLELFRGAANMVALLALYMFASNACPRRTEVSVMAILVALRNIATDASTFTGGQLLTNVFNNQFYPLVLIATLAPVLSFFLLQRLPLKTVRQADID